LLQEHCAPSLRADSAGEGVCTVEGRGSADELDKTGGRNRRRRWMLLEVKQMKRYVNVLLLLALFAAVALLVLKPGVDAQNVPGDTGVLEQLPLVQPPAPLPPARPQNEDTRNSVEESRRNAIVTAIERVAPAVVSVNVIQMHAERVRDPFSRDFWSLFYAPPPRYRLRERQLNSIGSGFIIDNLGHIVTNYHVVEDAEKVASVTLTDGREVEVELIGADERTDLAVLRAKGSNLPHVPFGDSSEVFIGEWAIAIGNPFGVLMKDPQPSVSVGVVSAVHRRISPSIAKGQRLYQDMIQTDAAINPGNSGGPLINAEGEVIGVNTMIFSTSGANVGLGFALPINRVRRVAEEIIRYGRRRDPWPGFKVEDITALRRDLREQLGLQVDQGGIVVNILTSAPAYVAGLRPGDAILAINGEPVSSSSDVDFVIWDLFVGDDCEIKIDRQGKRQTIRFEISELENRG